MSESFASELFTDLYELTMAASYFEEGMKGEATFSLFVRTYPKNRTYFVAAGIEQLLNELMSLHFRDSSLEYLASTGRFSDAFLDYLRHFRFTGRVRALPEGTIFFPQEPILEVRAPLIEAQVIETLVINAVQLDILVASKASRCVGAAGGRGLIDFSLRRTQGFDAGLKVARASYLAGFLGTSNVLAGKLYGIPLYGTMAHSYVTSFESEMDSFQAFARAFPKGTVLLIDTYDTVRGAKKAVEVAQAMAKSGNRLLGVRLDSGDLVSLSKEVRGILQSAGFADVAILASGSLDEFELEELIRNGAEIDTFAVGTRMGVSADAPYLDIAYKLVEYGGRPILKLSSGKKTWVGEKQVYRVSDESGMMQGDTVELLSGGAPPDARPLLEVFLERGERVRAEESLDEMRERFQGEFRAIPDALKELRPRDVYAVGIGPALRDLQERAIEETGRREALAD